MPEWIYFIHAPRENFAATMSEEERAVWGVLEAPDEEAARTIMDDDPVIAGGFARGELRPFKVSLLRGRD